MSRGLGRVEISILQALGETGAKMTPVELGEAIQADPISCSRACWSLKRKSLVRLGTGPLVIWLASTSLPVKTRGHPSLPLSSSSFASRGKESSNSGSPRSRWAGSCPATRESASFHAPEQTPSPPPGPALKAALLPATEDSRPRADHGLLRRPRARGTMDKTSPPGKLSDFEAARLIAPRALYASHYSEPPAMTLEHAIALLAPLAPPAAPPPAPPSPPTPAPKASDYLEEAGRAAIKLFGSQASPKLKSRRSRKSD